MCPYIRIIFAAIVLFILSPVANAQEVGSWSGAYGSVSGQYTGGVSTQRDNGFVNTAPAGQAAAPAPVAPPVVVPPAVVPPVVVPPGLPADGSYGLSGGFGGGGIGYNLQTGRFVYGVVAGISGGRATGSSAGCGTPGHSCGTSISAMADVRGRVGYAFSKLLIFGSGGLAVDNLHAYDALVGASGSAWRAGWVVGGGAEYRIAPHWTVAAEYLHADVESARLFDIAPGVPERISARSDTARISLNYYFSALASEPVIARY